MMKGYIIVGILFLLGISAGVQANNVRVDSLKWNADAVTGGKSDVLTMQMVVSWDNSWRDDFNYDAAYVFFKFKLKEADATSDAQPWNHLYLMDAGHQVSGGDYGYWLSPLSVTGQNLNTGIYLYRNGKGGGDNKVRLEVSWNIKNQLGVSLSDNDFLHGQVLVSAQAIEMVYVPRGAFRIGDGVSEKSFRRAWFPLEKEYDVMSREYTFNASGTAAGSKPAAAADRINDNTTSTASVWTGSADSWWKVDFGKGNAKTIKWFGINAYKHKPTYIPVTFTLSGSNNPDASAPVWQELWSGPGEGNWIMADDAYPIQKAIRIEPGRVGSYRSYMIQVNGMKAGVPMINSIGMSERDIDRLVDPSVLIDSPVTVKDTLRGLGARDGSVWTGTVPATFPNGYRGFYAMKYELSQDQYVRFLNKLTYRQQNTILDGRLEQLNEGDYLFGSSASPTLRNGIVVAAKMDNKPAVFACKLIADGDESNDGRNIACNYMNIADMLAYADWAGLRPLTEMEYEKMARPGYPYVPVAREYAWNSTEIQEAADLGSSSGTAGERPARGNANYGNNVSIGGPVRCGAFAATDPTLAKRRNTGAGYSGVMELSGNLAEMYYNVNNINGLKMVAESCSGSTHVTSHGDGSLDINGRYDGVKAASKNWQENPVCIALRGGSFADPAERLSVSDRSRFSGVLPTVYTRDSTVTFRLGHSVPEPEELVSVLTLENGKTTVGGDAADLLDNSMRTYNITGNKPAGISGSYTYIWYMREEGGLWRVLEGEDDANFILKGFAEDTRITQNYYLKRKVISSFADSETSSEHQVVLSRKAIVFNGLYRSWADGTFARSAMAYRYPSDPYKYEGAIGNGVYRIDPDGPEGPIEPFDVYCEMETSGGGWMLAAKFSNNDEKTWIAAKEVWTDTTTFGDATDVRSFRDAKSKVWALHKADTLMFKTMRGGDKAFKTVNNKLGQRTLSTFFTNALANFPNLKKNGCYITYNIQFLNGAKQVDFPWINGSAFAKSMITIANSDADPDHGADSMGVISGCIAGYDSKNDMKADCGLGISNTPRFGNGESESDVGTYGGEGPRDEYNVLLFVK